MNELITGGPLRGAVAPKKLKWMSFVYSMFFVFVGSVPSKTLETLQNICLLILKTKKRNLLTLGKLRYISLFSLRFNLHFQDPIQFLKKLDFNPIEELINEKFGCTQQCPFCHVSCDNGFTCDGKNRRHTSERHRPWVSVTNYT